MSVKIVIGSQWGDEGKGKIIDILSEKADVVLRSQGGNNAGHTVKFNGRVFALKLVPSGVLYPKVKCIIGSGTVINPKALIDEIESLKHEGVSFDNFVIDWRAHVITPWNLEFDEAFESLRGSSKIGTTKNGIGPCYADKAYRLGIRIHDLVDKNILEKKLKLIGSIENDILEKVFGKTPVDIDRTIDEYYKYGQVLKPFFEDSVRILHEALNRNQSILFEGAQGAMLDINFGTYPYVTSSSTLSGGVCTGSAIGPTRIDSTIGVAKAYLTRVGQGPMPTGICGEIEERIREVGCEFGTNTGRARRIGWLDCVMLKHAVRVNGIDQLAMNKLDVLKGLKTLKICYAYRDKITGNVIHDFPASIERLGQVIPVYEEFEGFDESIENCSRFDELPRSCQKYVKAVEGFCGCVVKMVGVGPGRLQNIMVEP